MPIIKEYVQQYSAGSSGDFTGRRATEADFGATNSGLYEFGTGVIKAADMLQSYEENKEVADAQQKVALSQADWAENMQQRTLSAKPGERIAPVLQEEMTDYYSKMAGNYRTKKAQDYVKFHGATTTKTAFRSALDFDVRLSAEQATSQFRQVVADTKREVVANPLVVEDRIKSQEQAIANREGIYANIPVGGVYDIKLKEEFRKEADDIRWMAMQGAKNIPGMPAQLLSMIAPSGPVAALTGETPKPKRETNKGISYQFGKANELTEVYAPIIDDMGKKYGVDTAFMRAQIMAESSGDKDAIGPQTKHGTAKGLTQFIDATAKRYGINPMIPSQAIKGQAMYMRDLLKMFDGDYRKAAAGYNWGEANVHKVVERYGDQWDKHLPEQTSKYVAKIVTAQQQAEVAQEPSAQAQPSDIPLTQKIEDIDPSKFPMGLGETWKQLSAERQLQYVNQLESEMKGEMATKRAELVNTLQDHKAQMSVYGNVPNPLSKGDFIAAYGAKAGEEVYRNYEMDRVAAADARKFATSSIPEIQSYLQTAKPGPNATAEDFMRFKKTAEFLTKAVEQRQKDGMGFELQSNQAIKPLTALEPNGDVLKFGNELAARIPSADVVSGKNGIPSVVSNQEGAMLHNAFRGSTLENKTKILHYTAMALRNNPTYFGQVIQKMIPDQPAAVYAAKIQFASKPATIGGREVWPEEVSRTILTGADYMGQFQESKAAKSDGSGSMAKGVMPDDSKMMKVFAEQMGTALRFHGPTVQEAYEAVKMHYAGSHIAAGNISGELDQEAFKRSIRTVIGPAVQAGTSQVIPPWGMDESTFKDEWKGRLMQQGINPEHVYTAKEISRNAYVVTLGGETGRQYVIDFNKEFKKEDKPMLNPSVTQGATQKATKTLESAKSGVENITRQFLESGFVIGQ